MAFERKKVEKKDVTNSYWQILQWLLILVPIFYFIFIFPTVFQSESNEPATISDFAVLLFHTFNLALGGLLMYTPPIERSRNGAADLMLKIMMVQQIITQNFFGFALVIIAWYKLPQVGMPEPIKLEGKPNKYLKPKALFILLGIITIISVLMVITVYTVN